MGEPRRHRELRARPHRRARATVDSEAPLWTRRSGQDAEHAARSRDARRSRDCARSRRPRHRQGGLHRFRAEQHRGTTRSRGARSTGADQFGSGLELLRELAAALVRQLLSRPTADVESFVARLEAADQRQSGTVGRARARSRGDHRPPADGDDSTLYGRAEEHLLRALLRAFSPIAGGARRRTGRSARSRHGRRALVGRAARPPSAGVDDRRRQRLCANSETRASRARRPTSF